MAPSKKTKTNEGFSKANTERLICKKKLETLELQESQRNEDRFTNDEKKLLLQAYHDHGFKVFQDMILLSKYIPNRTENDLLGLLQRLESGPSANCSITEDKLGKWQTLCSGLMGNFARDKRVNFDDILSDVMSMIASRIGESEVHADSVTHSNSKELLMSFSQMLAGRFPDNMSEANAAISVRLFESINMLIESSGLLESSSFLEHETWLSEATGKRRRILEEAKEALADTSVDSPVVTEENLAIYLELPKVKRIIESLNPLRLNLDEILGTRSSLSGS